MKATACPNCGANIEVGDLAEFEKCNYCGTNVKVREIIRYEQNYDIAEWFKIADVAYKAGNYEEAYEYYNKILEEESIHAKAWIGKGLSAGRLSEPEEQRLYEMYTLISQGYENIKDKKSFEFKKTLINEVYIIINKNYN
ncbi:tetratricopeptide repeat protein, partial [Bacillus pumilus]|uniref:tetratricopeptide repeat protein n=1 Tax=Bacillus pumilus TaxID=1408 RepID=UPI00331536BE